MPELFYRVSFFIQFFLINLKNFYFYINKVFLGVYDSTKW